MMRNKFYLLVKLRYYVLQMYMNGFNFSVVGYRVLGLYYSSVDLR